MVWYKLFISTHLTWPCLDNQQNGLILSFKILERLPAYLLVVQSCSTLSDPWTVARQAPLSKGFSRQEYWSGLPFPSPGDLPDPGVETARSGQSRSLPATCSETSRTMGSSSLEYHLWVSSHACALGLDPWPLMTVQWQQKNEDS